jgi:hypothetical protein
MRETGRGGKEQIPVNLQFTIYPPPLRFGAASDLRGAG